MDFSSGDVVRLKSGGPRMTIVNFDTKNGCYRCTWFEKDNERKYGCFEPEIIEPDDDGPLEIQMG